MEEEIVKEYLTEKELTQSEIENYKQYTQQWAELKTAKLKEFIRDRIPELAYEIEKYVEISPAPHGPYFLEGNSRRACVTFGISPKKDSKRFWSMDTIIKALNNLREFAEKENLEEVCMYLKDWGIEVIG